MNVTTSSFPDTMSSNPTLRAIQFVALFGFLLHWLLESRSLTSLGLALALFGLVAGLSWMTWHLPGLARTIAYGLMAAPFIAWLGGLFDDARYHGHGDGTWAYVPRLLYLGIALLGFVTGFIMWRATRDQEHYTEEDQIELLIEALREKK